MASSDTRSRLLATGIRLLHDRGVVSGVEHITLAAVCSRAGFTTGAGYRCWPSQRDFHRDLAIEALRWRDRPSSADTFGSIRAPLSADAPLLELLRVAAESSVTRRVDQTDFYVTLSVRLAALHNPALQPAAEQRVAEGTAAHGALFASVLSQYGREMRPPFTLHHLAAAAAALAEGFAVQDCTRAKHPWVHRDDVPPGVGREWTLFAVVLHLLLDAFTQPTTSPHARGFDQ